MSGIDLTEAIKAAHNPVFDAMITDGPDGHVDGYEQIATAAVTAAAPLIEAAVREKVAAEIEAMADHAEKSRDEHRASAIEKRAAGNEPSYTAHIRTARARRNEASAFRHAALIARGDS